MVSSKWKLLTISAAYNNTSREISAAAEAANTAADAASTEPSLSSHSHSESD